MSLDVPCLNRTFYGIETGRETGTGVSSFVLIVPFMELKLLIGLLIVLGIAVLIVPFMELKLYCFRYLLLFLLS